jgi:hypothetical protein
MTPSTSREGVLNRRRITAILVAVGVVLAGTGMLLAVIWERSSDPQIVGVSQSDDRLGDVVQDGARLGPFAPVRLHVFADPIAPAVRRFDEAILSDVLEQLVEPGRVQLNFNPIVDPDDARSAEVSRGILAAAAQDRGWLFVQLVHAIEMPDEASEIGRWLDRLASAADLDVRRFRSDLTAESGTFDDGIDAARRFASNNGMQRPLAFHVAGTGGDRFLDGSATIEELVNAVDAVSDVDE